MTQKVDRISEHEKVALQDRLTTALAEPATDRSPLNPLAIAFEECHTLPTGYNPTKIFQKESA